MIQLCPTYARRNMYSYYFKMAVYIILLCVCVTVAYGKIPNGPNSGNTDSNPFQDALVRDKLEVDTGYVALRPGAYMFWWLYYADGRRASSPDKPLIVWVQGGPGLPASGVGNFMEIGPLDIHFKKRNHTWVNGHNVLLIDSPVGTGFSREVNTNRLATRDKRVVSDFVNTVAGFLKVHPEFQTTDWHIFSQSYGGKLAPKIGYRLHKAVTYGKIKMNLKTVAIGSGFVNPSESLQAVPDYMFHMGLLDLKDYLKMKNSTDLITKYIQANKLTEAFLMNIQKYEGIPYILSYNKNNVNEDNDMSWYRELERISNELVKPSFTSTRNSGVQWECLPSLVYMSLGGNMMLSSKRYVEKLLNETSIKVIVYNGNFDAVTPMAGCVKWVHGLNWSGREHFANAPRNLIAGEHNGYYKVYDNLSMWWVLSAGHWVPNDNPVAMKEILKYATEH